MLKKLILTIILFVLSSLSYSQNSGSSWNIYTSLRETKGIALGNNFIWAATSGGLFNFDPNNPGNIKKYTSLDGLKSNELTAITTGNNGLVWVGAFDGSISVLNPSDASWRQITDISSSTEPSKRINAFYEYNNQMFFSTEFCIVKFNIPQFQFVDQPYTRFGNLTAPSAIYDIAVINDTIWAATRNGIAYANINNNLPISSNWSTFVTSNSVLKNNRTNCISYFDSKIFMGTDSGMVYYQNGTLNTYAPLVNGVPYITGVYRMAVSGNTMYFSAFSYEGINKVNYRIFRVDRNNINNAQLIESGTEVNSLKVNSNGDLLIGTVNNGVNVFRNNTNNFVFPNGPFSNLQSSLTVDKGGNLWSVSGSLGDWTPRSGIYKYENNLWKNYTYGSDPIIGGGCCGWVNVYPDIHGNMWVAGWGNGLLKINGNDLTRYDESNSILQANGSAGFVLTYGMDEDNSGNLWVLNNFVTNSIVNFTQQVSYPAPVGNTAAFFTTMAIDNFNTKWMTLHPIEGNVRGVMYFNEGSSPTGALIGYSTLGTDIGQVNQVITDKNGEVWIATNNGVIVIPNPEQVINNPGSIPTLFKMRIIENGISTPLTANVLSIAVDALNNKWLGTISDGVIYVSPDGSTLLQRYNMANSYLVDNKIVSISTDNSSGKVYFGSEKGLVSYNTIAVNPLSECDQIKVGPNPFIIPGNSLLRIDGLVEESTVKILSISGVLVSEFETPGGRIANWDGRDLNGNYVSSGIYIIAGYNKDGSKVCKGKVAIVRQ
jgi:ligand-binding sensor domain-containing protein